MKHLLTVWTLIFAVNSVAQPPAGYYNSAAGLTGDSLRFALHQIIDNHTGVSYASLWNHFQVTDTKGGNIVWDMYSDVPSGTAPYSFTFVTDQCGNYAAEGDCYNREHSFPKSWFGDLFPMNTDLFHLYPTDGYVNGKRSDHPFGEVNAPTWTSQNGSRVGPNVFPGYTGTVFEPLDEYKGDFARSYFYMLTRYMDISSGWNSDMLQGNNFSSWAIDMLLQWSESDTVSTKEINRNNVVYQIQGNRNPYIDQPVFAQMVWDSTWTENPGPNPGMAGVNQANLNAFYSNGIIYISPNVSGILTVMDISGRLVLQTKASTAVPFQESISGVYHLVITTDNGAVLVRRFFHPR